jgi:lipopolysaccharide/colanic/teichoic acid biosynthesis glycosyltransferase
MATYQLNSAPVQSVQSSSLLQEHFWLDLLLPFADAEVLKFLSLHVDLKADETMLCKTHEPCTIEAIEHPFQAITNLEKVNNVRRVNKFHELVNSKLTDNGIYIGCAETKTQRVDRIFSKFPKRVAIPFLFVDFIYKRVLPKLPYIRRLYFAVTRGHNRVMSKAEILGRLVSCGFEIRAAKEINNLLYFVAEKVKEPEFNLGVSYGPIFKMKRVGRGGNVFKFYKLRTMHPYAEYLQKSITHQNGLAKNGKMNGDYRVTIWGKYLRKYWIDELPMLINLIKGDLKLFGVRPLSLDYFSRYPKKIQELRTKTKPGLIPPYYVDLPNSFEEILSSEERYLNEYFRSPFMTDLKYLIQALHNIIFRGKRSA